MAYEPKYATYGKRVNEEMECPECGRGCARDEVDIGVGLMFGPWGCCCGWSEADEFSHSRLKGFDQYGGYHPLLDSDRSGWTEYQKVQSLI